MHSAVQSSGLDRHDRRVEAGATAPVRFSRLEADSFGPVVDSGRIGGFDCARVTQRSHAPDGNVRHLRPCGLAEYLVILQVSGRTGLEHAGRVVELSPGDITLVDTAAACRFEFERKNIHLCVQLPRNILERHPCLVEGLGTTLPRSFSVFLGSLLQSSFQQTSTHDSIKTQAIADALIGLIVAGWSGTQPACIQGAASRIPPMLERIQEYVVANLHSEALAPCSIAQVHGISERQLHRLFRTAGTSVCRWIRQCRLDRCASDLRDNRQLQRSITEIAFRWGFNDAAHFSRMFRAEFDASPSHYRASAFSNARVANISSRFQRDNSLRK